MVMLKTTSLAILLGSAALSSAAVLPSVHNPEARDGLVNKREWKGKLGARGPWRQENDHFVSLLERLEAQADITVDQPRSHWGW